MREIKLKRVRREEENEKREERRKERGKEKQMKRERIEIHRPTTKELNNSDNYILA